MFPAAGVNGHARGLVDGDDVVIFVKNIKWNRFRRRVRRWPRVALTVMSSPPRSFCEDFADWPLTRIRPPSTSSCTRERESSGAVGGHEPVEPRAQRQYQSPKVHASRVGLQTGHGQIVAGGQLEPGWTAGDETELTSRPGLARLAASPRWLAAYV